MSDARCNACDKTYDKAVLPFCPYCDTPNGIYQDDDDDWKPSTGGNTVLLVLVSMLAGGAGAWWIIGPKMDIGADGSDRHPQAIADGVRGEAGINGAYSSASESPVAAPPPPAPPKKRRATGVCDRLIQRCQKIQTRAARLERKVARIGMLNLSGKSRLDYQVQMEKLRLCYQFLGNINSVNWHLGRRNRLTKDICRMGVKTLKLVKL